MTTTEHYQTFEPARRPVNPSVRCLQTLYETMAMGVVYQSADGAITAANPAAEALLGLTVDEMRGPASMESPWQALRRDGTDMLAEEHPAIVALRTGLPVRDVIVGVFHPLSGETRWQRVNSIPEFRNGEVRPYQVYSTLEDVTEQHAAQTVLESISDGFILLDLDWRFSFLNSHAARMLLRTREALLGKSFWGEFPDMVGTVCEREFRRAMDLQVPVSFELFHLPLSAWLEMRAYPSRAGVSVYFQDTCARVAAQKALLESHERLLESDQRLRMAIDSGKLGFYDLDLTTNEFRSVSAIYKDLFGIDPKFALTRAESMQAVHPDDLAGISECLARRLSRVNSDVVEFRVHWPDGSEHWLRSHGLVVGADGQPERMIGLVMDITEQKATEAALRGTAESQRVLLRDLLSSVTGGRLRLVEAERDLPAALIDVSEPIPLTALDGLRALRERVKDAAFGLGFAESRWQDTVTAASEGGMNAITHGGGKGEAQVSSDGIGTIQVRVRDWGAGINRDNLPRATLQRGWSSTTSLGHGMVMMLEMTDRLYLRTGPGEPSGSQCGTTVVMEHDRDAPLPAWL